MQGECADIEELFRLVGSTLGRSFAKAPEPRKQRDNRPIRQAKQYIEEKINRSTYPEEVSEMVSSCSPDISAHFKKRNRSQISEPCSQYVWMQPKDAGFRKRRNERGSAKRWVSRCKIFHKMLCKIHRAEAWRNTGRSIHE